MAEHRGWPYEPDDLTDPVTPPSAPAPSIPEPVQAPPAPPGDEPESTPLNRTAIIVAVVAGFVATALAVAGVTDWWVRNRELDRVLDGVERSERAQYSFLDIAASTQSSCIRRSTCDLTAVVRAAKVALPELQRSGEQVADADVARFHGGIKNFRTVYLDHNRAWQEFLSGVVLQPIYYTQPSDDIETTWEKVGNAAPRAIPPLPLHDARGRIEEILRGR
jgi:hypothetical protein